MPRTIVVLSAAGSTAAGTPTGHGDLEAQIGRLDLAHADAIPW